MGNDNVKIKKLKDKLRKCDSIRELDLSGMDIADYGVDFVVDAFFNPKCKVQKGGFAYS